MTRPITVGVDHSTDSRVAGEWAAREAERRGLPLRLVHVWLDEPAFLAPPDRAEAERLLGAFASETAARHPGLEVTGEVVIGSPVARLVDQGARAELLVLGARGAAPGHAGAAGGAGFPPGSVSLPVAAHATGPVVLVRKAPFGTPHAEREVVLGLDTTEPAAAPLLDCAFTLAAARGAVLRAVRVFGPPAALSRDAAESIRRSGSGEAAERAGQALRAALAPWRRRFPQVPVVPHLRFGNAAEELLAAASGRGPLLLGRRTNRPPLSPRLGPTARVVLHHSRVPVLVVPHD